MKKEAYKCAVLEIIVFSGEDVIMTSPAVSSRPKDELPFVPAGSNKYIPDPEEVEE